MTCNFRVGQKVVCINDEWNAFHAGIAISMGVRLPIAGQVYTLRGIEVRGERTDLYLAEIVNPVIEYADVGFAEQGFHYLRFRPVVERGTEKGMSILRDLLNKTGKPVEVVA